MRLPSSSLPPTTRSAFRFLVVGTTGMFIQDGLYRLCLAGFRMAWPDVAILVSVAFAIGFLLEMISNYLLTAYYTFESKPDIRNASGFLLARAINFVVQFAFLHTLITCGMSEHRAGFPSIFLAGIVNYFVTRIFFKEKAR